MDEHDEAEEGYAASSLGDDPDPLGGSRVLWGRVVVLLVALQLAFILGRCTSSGVPKEDFDRVNQQLASTRSELEKEREQDRRPSPSPQASPSPSPSPSPETRTYIVRPGDTLREISQRVYGTPTLANFIGEANNVESSNLKVGAQLTIPPRPSPTSSPSPG